MGTNTILIVAAALYAIITVGFAWTAQRLYRDRNGHDMHHEHVTATAVLAVLWPLTLTALLIAATITALRKDNTP